MPDTTQFWKWTERRLRLILGVEYHRFYDDTFTASLYLGRTFTFALHTATYPRRTGFRRVGELVPHLESPDHWWHGFVEDNVNQFLAAIPTFESRFLAQPGLLTAVAEEPELTRREEMIERIAQVTHSLASESPGDLVNQPRRYPRELPPQWFWAAEIVLRTHGNSEDRAAGQHKVLMLGLDAWRCFETIRDVGH